MGLCPATAPATKPLAPQRDLAASSGDAAGPSYGGELHDMDLFRADDSRESRDKARKE